LAYVQKTMAPDKIFLAGDSAGGNLVMSTLLAVNNPRLLEEEMEIIQKQVAQNLEAEESFQSETPISIKEQFISLGLDN